MVVLLEKDSIPPPPYFAVEHSSSPSLSQTHLRASASSSSLLLTHAQSSRGQGRWAPAPNLPSHVLLLITYEALPKPDDLILDRRTGLRRRMDNSEFAVRTTRTLYWMGFCLRAVNRGFYLGEFDVSSVREMDLMVLLMLKLLCISCVRPSCHTTFASSDRHTRPTRSRRVRTKELRAPI